MGVLTKYLLEQPSAVSVIEIDTESVAYLNAHYPKLHGHIIEGDFLKTISRRHNCTAPPTVGDSPPNASHKLMAGV